MQGMFITQSILTGLKAAEEIEKVFNNKTNAFFRVCNSIQSFYWGDRETSKGFSAKENLRICHEKEL